MRACAERASTVRLSSLPKRSLLSPRPVGLVGCDDLGGALAGSHQRRPSRWASIAARNKTLASGSGVGVGSGQPLRARVYDVCIPAPPAKRKQRKNPGMFAIIRPPVPALRLHNLSLWPASPAEYPLSPPSSTITTGSTGGKNQGILSEELDDGDLGSQRTHRKSPGIRARIQGRDKAIELIRPDF